DGPPNRGNGIRERDGDKGDAPRSPHRRGPGHYPQGRKVPYPSPAQLERRVEASPIHAALLSLLALSCPRYAAPRNRPECRSLASPGTTASVRRGAGHSLLAGGLSHVPGRVPGDHPRTVHEIVRD